MARSESAVNNITTNVGAAVTTVALTNGATGTDGYELTGVRKDYNLNLLVKNTGSATGVFSLKSGDFAAKSRGDLTEVIGAGVVKAYQIDGARFLTEDSTVAVDSGITGTLYATQS